MGDEIATPKGVTVAPAGFDAFWQAWPDKRNRKAAVKAWGKLTPGDDLLAQILAAIERQSDQWRRGIIPHASTWLNNERWEDEPPVIGRNLTPVRTAAELAAMDPIERAIEENRHKYQDPEVAHG